MMKSLEVGGSERRFWGLWLMVWRLGFGVWELRVGYSANYCLYHITVIHKTLVEGIYKAIILGRDCGLEVQVFGSCSSPPPNIKHSQCGIFLCLEYLLLGRG